jgi:hypothetical protein
MFQSQLLSGWGTCLTVTCAVKLPLVSMGAWAEGKRAQTREPAEIFIIYLLLYTKKMHSPDVTFFQKGFVVGFWNDARCDKNLRISHPNKIQGQPRFLNFVLGFQNFGEAWDNVWSWICIHVRRTFTPVLIRSF